MLAIPRGTDIQEPIVRQSISWEQFLSIQKALEVVPNLRLNYWEGWLEIMHISKQHELICALLGTLLGLCFLHKHLKFFPSGAYSQIVEGKVQFQADLSYSFEVDKEVPDLCIEVVISSANTDKLCKYQLRGIPGVWFWQENKI